MPSSEVARLAPLGDGRGHVAHGDVADADAVEHDRSHPRQAVGGADALGVVAVANIHARALRVIVGERDDRGARIDQHVDRPAIDLDACVVVSVRAGPDLDGAASRQRSRAGSA